MRPVLLLLPLFALLLSACYDVDGPTVTQGVRAEAAKDGRWRRSDGSEVTLAWNAAEGAYGIGAGGRVRLAPLGRLWLADYQAKHNVVLLARISDEQVEFYAPSPAAEKRLAAAHGLGVLPGPVSRLPGDAAARRRYFSDLAALDGSGELQLAERLVWVGPL